MLRVENALSSHKQKEMQIGQHTHWEEALIVNHSMETFHRHRGNGHLVDFGMHDLMFWQLPMLLLVVQMYQMLIWYDVYRDIFFLNNHVILPLHINDCISVQVIHYELPNSSEIFVHRTGRTGRAGKKGIAILIHSEHQMRDVRTIEQHVGCRFKEVVKFLFPFS